MSFASIVGQDRVKEMLKNAVNQNRLSHAYIFSGPPGTGRRKMALALAKAIFCENFTEDACNQCVQCRRIEHGNHPGVFWLEPEGASVKIEQIRELQRQFSYRTFGTKKMYIIHQSEKMTVQAANSLLKFFEEPQGEVIAVLIVENAHALLSTIRSRAQWIHFSPLPPSVLLQKLIEEGFPPALASPASHIAAGLDQAREYIQDPKFAEMRNIVIQLVKESFQSIPAVIAEQKKLFKSEWADHLPLIMELLALWYKDLIRIQVGRTSQLVYPDQEEWLSQNAFSRPLSFWVQRMEQALEMKKRLRLHVNAQLALERFWVEQGG